MSGMEVITVVACVAAIVSAYRDGCELYHTLKLKRERRRHLDELASHSAELEDSLARGHEEILSHWNSYASRLGRRYEEGDSRAREQIKDILITVQSMLLSHLRRAVEHGVRLDILELLSTSNLARKNTLSLLQEMYQRISPSPHLPYAVEMGSMSTVVDPSSSLGYYIHLMDRTRSLSEPRCQTRMTAPPNLSTILSGQLSVSPTEIQGLSRHGETIFPQRERKPSGFGSAFSSLWSHRSKRGSGGRSSNGSLMTLTEDQEEKSRTRQPSACDSEGYAGMVFSPDPISDVETKGAAPKKKHRRRSSIKEDPSQTEKEGMSGDMKHQLTHNPWIERSQYGSDSESDDGSISPTTEEPKKQFQPNHKAPTQPTTPSHPSHSNPPATSGSFSNHSTHSSDLTVVPTIPLTPRRFWPPSKANNYSGFCKGAWKLSSGLGGFKTYTEPIGYYLLISKWRCYRCYFGMPLAPGSKRHDIRFDQKIYEHKGTGIRYRWSFLAKSHLAYTKPGVSAPTHVCGSFGCIFCCAEMDVLAPRLESLDAFMVHLGAQHRSMDVALLERTRCVVGRVAADQEGFDINIPPA